jgi:hypothetical protein
MDKPLPLASRRWRRTRIRPLAPEDRARSGRENLPELARPGIPVLQAGPASSAFMEQPSLAPDPADEGRDTSPLALRRQPKARPHRDTAKDIAFGGEVVKPERVGRLEEEGFCGL